MKLYEAAKLIREKKVSSEELTKKALENIYSCDERVFISVCEDALKQAKEVDSGRINSPLSGIPVAIKDNICVKGVPATAAGKILSDFTPCYDATVIKRLKEQGAVIIGKTTMDEFGMGNSNENSAFGAISNPVNSLYVPGGSSGGSAVAVKRDMCIGALGSDTGGSIRQPAAFCGVYGLKPTYSLISRYGLIAFASSLDCIGPFGKSSMDLAIITDAIAGFDKMDATSAKREYRPCAQILTEDIRGLKIGIPQEFYENMDEDVKIEVMNAIKNLEGMGTFVEFCSIPSVKYASAAYYVISSSEVSSNLSRYDGVKFGKRAECYEDIEDMYIKTRSENFGREVKKRILFGTMMLSENFYDLYYMKAQSARNLIKKEFEKLFEKYDVLITPVSLARVWKLGEGKNDGDKYSKDFCTTSVSLAGLPAINVPCGKDKNGMPVSFQVIGNNFDEKKILSVAYAYEKGGFFVGI